TTYSYGGSSDLDDDSVDAIDTRLPPGGFSLRHGFPAWFARRSSRVPSGGSATAGMPATPAKQQAGEGSESAGSPSPGQGRSARGGGGGEELVSFSMVPCLLACPLDEGE